MKRKRIVFVNRFFYPDHSATSQMLTDLAFALAAGGTHVEIITSRLRYDDTEHLLSASEQVNRVLVHRVWSSRIGRDTLWGRAIDYVTFYAAAMAGVWRVARRDTIIVIKTDPPLISVFAAPVARLRGAVQVNWLQDLFPEVAAVLRVPMSTGATGRLLRVLRNWTLRTAKTNVVLGDRMRALVAAQGVSSSQATIIHNWADGEAIRPIAPDSNPMRAAWGLEGKFVVCYSGNLGRAHDFDTVLGAAQQLLSRPDVVFLFIGGGAQRVLVEEESRRRGLSNVQFRPYQPRERLSETLGVADVHLVSLNPALEGMIVPSKFYGIAAAGRATLFIGDDQGEIARILREEDCGRSIAPGDAQGLARWVQLLSADPAMFQRMGENARRAFEHRFDCRIAVQAWKDVLERAAS